MVSFGVLGFDLLKVEEKGLSLILGLNKGGVVMRMKGWKVFSWWGFSLITVFFQSTTTFLLLPVGPFYFHFRGGAFSQFSCLLLLKINKNHSHFKSSRPSPLIFISVRFLMIAASISDQDAF